ncbi:MAG: hypothetical protein D6806_06900 [Deltaproteobacteria bacterium]|nr:MAG: hypothetical protein D6806_06900 [Deltaproteobacteria bacterium]
MCRTVVPFVCAVASCLIVAGCSAGGGKACRGDHDYGWKGLFAGPAEAGYNEALVEVAKMRDRQFWALHALPTGLNTEISIDRSKTEVRQAVEDFLRKTSGWDFEAATGISPAENFDAWHLAAGAYAGVGLAADAYRYGVMRDQCYPPEQVDTARQQLLRAIDGWLLAMEVTGKPGVIARAIMNRDYPGTEGIETVPLFDGQGNPLPEEKNNGTWREDQSGEHPNIIWVDSCSRDMLIGWVVGLGAAWEVIENDETIPVELKERLRSRALELADNLRRVRPNGYDLELEDADGRTTFHGYLNENNLDRMYIDGVRNGFHAIMALGIIAALVDVTGDRDLENYLYKELIDERDFARIAAENTIVINMEEVTNFSNYNMAFEGAWLALRHLHRDPIARQDIREAVEVQLFDTPGKHFQPAEFGHAFFDLVTVASRCDAEAGVGCRQAVDEALIQRIVQTLSEFPQPPFWEFKRENCDDREIASGSCIAEDGQTHLTVLGEVGRNGDLIVAEPLPMRLRPVSNYYWRSNPYKPNGGNDGPGMYAGPDFRMVYWAARWLRRPAE